MTTAFTPVGTDPAVWTLDVRDGDRAVPWQELRAEIPEIRAILRRYGVVLLRGIRPLVDVATELREAAIELGGLPNRPYHEQSSPRTEVGDGVFTATDFPAHADMFLHNELSYATSWPRLLFFYCHQPSEEGGQTNFADSRVVHDAIPERIRAEFAARSWMYQRNLRGDAGLSWQKVFATTSKEQAERYCVDNEIELEWCGSNARLRAVRPATLDDEIGSVWFNHIAAFHVSTLPARLATSLRRLYSEETLPANTYFGDGEPIPDKTVASIRSAYVESAVDVPWQRGDLAIVDNQRVAHGRRAYRGTRKLFVVLSGEGRRSPRQEAQQ